MQTLTTSVRAILSSLAPRAVCERLLFALFWHRIARAAAAFDSLLTAWREGTLAPTPAPPIAPTPLAPTHSPRAARAPAKPRPPRARSKNPRPTRHAARPAPPSPTPPRRRPAAPHAAPLPTALAAKIPTISFFSPRPRAKIRAYFVTIS
jgi:hypothetical protein